MLTKVISKNGLILAAFAAVCVGLIAITYFITKDTIDSEMKAALARTLDQIVPAKDYNNDVHHDCTLIPITSELKNTAPLEAYRMRKNGQPVALVMETVAPNGYSGKIALVVGIYYDETIAGVRVTDHKETPGLGAEIEKGSITSEDQIDVRGFVNGLYFITFENGTALQFIKK